MSLPGIGVVLAIGTALAGVLYLLYQQSQTQNQYTYGGHSDREPDYDWRPIDLPDERRTNRRRKNVTCSICLDGSSTDNLKTLDCDHSFHKRCIDLWLQNHNTCPNCRKVI